jgi:hypothetical protein
VQQAAAGDASFESSFRTGSPHRAAGPRDPEFEAPSALNIIRSKRPISGSCAPEAPKGRDRYARSIPRYGLAGEGLCVGYDGGDAVRQRVRCWFRLVKGPLKVSLALIQSEGVRTMGTKTSPTIAEQDISDSYIYLLARLLVTRQQQLDFKEGFKWNELIHRKPGEVDWPNPNLDVAYSEAWVQRPAC